MKKALLGKVGLSFVVVSSLAFADGPPPGAKLTSSFDGQGGKAIAYTGGVVTTPRDPKNGMAIGKPVMSPLKVTVSNGMPQGFYSWLGSSLGGGAGAHTIGLSSIDASGKAVGGLTVKSPAVDAVVFPAMSRGDLGAATIDVTLDALGSNVTTTPGGGASAVAEERASTWTRSGFTASVAGLPAPSGVSSLTITIPRDIGTGMVAGKTTIGQMHVYFDAASKSAVDPWVASHSAKDVRVVYQTGTTKADTKTLYELDLKGCAPVSEAFSGSVDVVVQCADVAFKLAP